MANVPEPLFAGEKKAAAILDMKVSEFLGAVGAGHLPKAREIVPGFPRWDVEELKRIARGDAAFGDEMQWP